MQMLAEAPRVVALAAPEGFDKIRTLRRHAAQAGTFDICAFTPIVERWEAYALVLDALATGDAQLRAEAASARLQSGTTINVDVLREAWKRRPLRSHLLLIRDAGGLLTAPGIELLTELVATAPPERRIALAVRSRLPAGIAIRDIVAIDRTDLELTDRDVPAFASACDLDEHLASTVISAARGIPLAARCFAFAHATAPIDRVRNHTRDISDGELVAYAIDQVVSSLEAALLEPSLLLAATGSSTGIAMRDLFGSSFDFDVASRLEFIPFINRNGDDFAIHPAAARILHARFPERLERTVSRAIERAADADAIVTASTIALSLGDIERAAQIIDGREPADIPLALTERLVARLEPEALPRYSSVWLAAIPFRRFAVDRKAYLHEAQLMYHCLPPNATAIRRAYALMHLASAERDEGRSPTAFALLDEALDDFARDPSPARASLLTFAATLHGVEGRFSRARDLARDAAAINRTNFLDDLALHYVDVHEAFFRGRYERGFVVIDEVLRRNRKSAGPLYVAYAAMNGAIFAWAANDSERLNSYIGALEEALTPGLERGFAPALNGYHQRAIEDDGNTWPVQTAIGQLFRLSGAETQEAMRAHARAAAIAADDCGDPYLQMLAYASLTALGDATAGPSLRRAIAHVESPEIHAAVDALLARSDDLGMLAPLIEQRLRVARTRSALLRIELLSGRVLRDGQELHFTPKELEFIAFLAASRSAVTRDAIGEALWPHVDEDEWANNVKVTVSRVRRKCGHDSVVAEEGRYRIASETEIDLRDIESMLRSLSPSTLPPAIERAFSYAFQPYRAGFPKRLERYEWFAPTLVRIHDAASSIGLVLARAAFDREAFPDAIELAEAVLAIDTFREDAFVIAVMAEAARDEHGNARLRIRRFLDHMNECGLDISSTTRDAIETFETDAASGRSRTR